MDNAQIVGVLAGGDSPEREISLISGEHVHQALCRIGHSTRLLTIDSLDDIVSALSGIDVVFNCLHGGGGEDGTVQLLLDVIGIPYAGSDPQACARAMDKPQAKAMFALNRIPTPKGITYTETDEDELLNEVSESLGFPLVVKPTNAGSTIGVHLVRDDASLRAAAGAVLEEFGDVLVETYIPGREITVGILQIDGQDQPLPVIEIRLPDGLFDYSAKYTEGVAEFLVPAPLDDKTSQHIQDVSLHAHQVLNCYGFSRVDLRLSEDETPYVLEVNTLPGMTPMSDLPRAAAAAGIPLEELVERMLQTAVKEEG